MKSRTLLNLVLLALVAALVLLAIYEPGKEPPPEPKRLTGVAPDSVEAIRIERPGAPAIELQRQDGQWRLTTPVAVAANSFRVRSVLELLEAKASDGFPADEAGLERYGLAEPRVQVTFDGATTVSFGETAPLDRRRYVRLGDTIFLIGDNHFWQVAGDAGTFIDPQLLPADAAITRLALPDFTVERGEDGWRLIPEPADYSADAVAALVENWRHARALQLHLQEPPSAESARIEVGLEGQGDPLVFLLDEAGGEALFVRPDLGVAYQLPAATAEGLLQLPSPDRQAD